MVAFIDTSTLVKKYVEEQGSDKLSELLEEIREIIVAPTYLIEFHSALRQKGALKELSPKQADWLLSEARRDLRYFVSVKWNEELEQQACRLVTAYGLKSLDAVQLGAAVLARPELLLTSDRALYAAAKIELKAVKFV